jgi:hypothetical protein
VLLDLDHVYPRVPRHRDLAVHEPCDDLLGLVLLGDELDGVPRGVPERAQGVNVNVAYDALLRSLASLVVHLDGLVPLCELLFEVFDLLVQPLDLPLLLPVPRAVHEFLPALQPRREHLHPPPAHHPVQELLEELPLVGVRPHAGHGLAGAAESDPVGGLLDDVLVAPQLLDPLEPRLERAVELRVEHLDEDSHGLLLLVSEPEVG